MQVNFEALCVRVLWLPGTRARIRLSRVLGLMLSIFTNFLFVKMNEEAKRSMAEWQEKLDKVTKDSEERISELQQKLAKVRNDSYLQKS